MTAATPSPLFVPWFRSAAPYINAFRGRTFVIEFGGEVVADATACAALIHDIALLHSLGVRLVLVHGARPQIEQRLQNAGAVLQYVAGLRVTDDTALACVKEACALVRLDIEARFSQGLANSPMAGARIKVISGNFVMARPLGVRDGVDYQHTGAVRRVDIDALRLALDHQMIVLLSPLGYSPTGEIFNLTAVEIAAAAAAALSADKLIYLIEGAGLRDRRRRLLRELALADAATHATKLKPDDPLAAPLRAAVDACQRGVRRAHLINRHVDGALLLELFTRDGVGTLIAGDLYEGTRDATVDDIGGLLELITPLEQEGVLVRRSRERLEMEIDHFVVVERDGTIIACAALHPYPDEGVGELACLVVHPDYRAGGRGEALLADIERRARARGLRQLFVLTTQTAHWFIERGFAAAGISALPITRQRLYNYRRHSKVFIKPL